MHLARCIIDPESGENVVSSTNGSRGTHFAVYSDQEKWGKGEGRRKFMCYLDISSLMDLCTVILHRARRDWNFRKNFDSPETARSASPLSPPPKKYIFLFLSRFSISCRRSPAI